MTLESDLHHLLNTHLIIVDNEIIGKDVVVHLLIEEIRKATDKNNVLTLCLN